MADERYSFTQARTRLEEIVAQVRKKDTSLEKSLDLLEEGVRLANVCTEQSDHTEWRSVVQEQQADTDADVAQAGSDGEPEATDAPEAQDTGAETVDADLSQPDPESGSDDADEPLEGDGGDEDASEDAD